MSKILYVLQLITLGWTAIAFAGIPAWMLFTRRNRRYHRANNWADDFQFDGGPSHVERADMADAPPASCHAGATYQVAS